MLEFIFTQDNKEIHKDYTKSLGNGGDGFTRGEKRLYNRIIKRSRDNDRHTTSVILKYKGQAMGVNIDISSITNNEEKEEHISNLYLQLRAIQRQINDLGQIDTKTLIKYL